MRKNALKAEFMSFNLIFLLTIGAIIGFTFYEKIINEVNASNAKIIVDFNGGGNYTSIQAAIDNASSGDIIYVWNGIYYENIIINKSITLIGNGTEKTIINGSGNDDVVCITVDWVNISGFTITGSGNKSEFPITDAGIEGYLVENITIKNNNCSANDYGIYFLYSNNNLVFNNTCNYNSKIGIHFWGGDFNKILNNSCNLNKRAGISMYINTNSNTVTNNYCSNSIWGIHLYDSNSNLMVNNTSKKNEQGLTLAESNNNNIFINIISNNNNTGIWIDEYSGNNYFYYNNIISNTIQANDTGYNFWNNSNQEGNYWSDYTGLDTGYMTYPWDITGKHLIAGDGIGDTLVPHLGLDYYPFTNELGWLKPGTPILDDPGDVDSDGNYNLTWISTARTIGYALEEDNSSSFDSPTEIYNGSSLIFNISRKTNGTYYYRVKAYNEKYESPWSNIVDIIVDWLPNIPENLSASTYPPGNTLNLTWDLNLIDTNQYILEYKNETMTNWQQIDPISHPGFTYNHTGLVDGERYDYRIQAKDYMDQLSNFSEIISGIPWDSVPPAPPTGLRVVSTTNDSISLKWNPNTEEDLEGYYLFRSKKSNPSDWGEPIGTIPKGTEEYLDTGLNENTTYYYVLTAFDEVPNNSSYSNIAFGTTILGPHGPVINNSQDDFSIPEDMIDDSTINLYYWFKDINYDPLEFKCKGNENITVTIFQENGTVILIPKKDWNGQETLTFYANDSISAISDNVTITVTPVNDPPGPAVIIKPEEGIKIENGTAINFSGICDDVDLIYGDKLTFNWSSNISGKFGSGENLTDIILQPGHHQITLEVSDIVGETSIAIVNITIFENITSDHIPMFDIKLELVPNIVELKPGEETTVKAIVTNLGEVDDRVVINIPEQNIEGIEVVINDSKIKNVIVNGTAEFNITIKALDNAENGEIEITIVAASAIAAEYEIILEKQAILTINITGVEKQQKADKESSFADYWVILLIIIMIIIILIVIGLLIKRKKQPPPEEPPPEELTTLEPETITTEEPVIVEQEQVTEETRAEELQEQPMAPQITEIPEQEQIEAVPEQPQLPLAQPETIGEEVTEPPSSTPETAGTSEAVVEENIQEPEQNHDELKESDESSDNSTTTNQE